MPAEVNVEKRIAAAKKLVKSGTHTAVGALQSALKKEFGKGIPPKRLAEVFGTTGKTKSASKRKTTGKRGPGRPRKNAAQTTAATASAPRTRGSSDGFAIDTSTSNGLDYWAELVAYLNQNTTGRTKFSIRLDGQTASLVAE